MKTTEEVLEPLREFKRTAGEKYGIEQLGLFSSIARGLPTSHTPTPIRKCSSCRTSSRTRR